MQPLSKFLFMENYHQKKHHPYSWQITTFWYVRSFSNEPKNIPLLESLILSIDGWIIHLYKKFIRCLYSDLTFIVYNRMWNIIEFLLCGDERNIVYVLFCEYMDSPPFKTECIFPFPQNLFNGEHDSLFYLPISTFKSFFEVRIFISIISKF